MRKILAVALAFFLLALPVASLAAAFSTDERSANASSIDASAADMDGNGSITVADALSILRRAMQLA